MGSALDEVEELRLRRLRGTTTAGTEGQKERMLFFHSLPDSVPDLYQMHSDSGIEEVPETGLRLSPSLSDSLFSRSQVFRSAVLLEKM